MLRQSAPSVLLGCHSCLASIDIAFSCASADLWREGEEVRHLIAQFVLASPPSRQPRGPIGCAVRCGLLSIAAAALQHLFPLGTRESARTPLHR